MTRILWVSKHLPRVSQLEYLKHVFGDIEIIPVRNNQTSSADEIIQQMNNGNCQEVVAVLPLHLLRDLVMLGVKPLKARMVAMYRKNGVRRYRFEDFERIVELNYKSQPI